jgi:hypothetical protein
MVIQELYFATVDKRVPVCTTSIDGAKQWPSQFHGHIRPDLQADKDGIY